MFLQVEKINKMIRFFDIIAFNCYKVSSTFFHSINLSKSKEDAKIQTIFLITAVQSINLFFIIIDFLLVKYFCFQMPKIILIIGISIILVLNYIRYVHNNKLENMESTLFFKNQYFTYFLIVLYFFISGYAMLFTGDYVRESYLLNCND